MNIQSHKQVKYTVYQSNPGTEVITCSGTYEYMKLWAGEMDSVSRESCHWSNDNLQWDSKIYEILLGVKFSRKSIERDDIQ